MSIVMLDTDMLCGNSNDFSHEKPRGPLHAVNAHRQLDWLQERLARSKADFLLVAGHYPVWSVSSHGPTACLLRKLRPLLIKHNATAYLCGHDHNLQVRITQWFRTFLFIIFGTASGPPPPHPPPPCPLQYINESGVGYVVSGAGNFLDPDISHWNKVPNDTVEYFNGRASTLGGFAHVEVAKNEMTLTFVQARGTSLYKTVLKDRNSA